MEIAILGEFSYWIIGIIAIVVIVGVFVALSNIKIGVLGLF